MPTSVFISTHNPYPDYTTKYQVMRDVNTQVSPDFTNYNDAAAWAASNGYCVISGSMGWNAGDNPPCPVTVSAPSPSLITVQIGIVGSGKVLSSGGDNTLAERGSISVPSGYKAYFQATPSSGYTFTKWVSADGISSSQNPIELPVTVNGSITAYFTANPVSSPITTKPPASGTPETFYETYRGYTINTQGSYLHVLRPDGTGIGLFNSVIAARQGVDADIDSLTPKAPTTTTCPNGQYLDISSPIPHCLPYPTSPAEAGTPAYAPPIVPGTTPSSCGTGTYYDYGTGKCLTLTPPAQPVQSQPQPEKPKDLTILYLLGAAAIGAAALLFGGKK